MESLAAVIVAAGADVGSLAAKTAAAGADVVAIDSEVGKAKEGLVVW